MRVSYRREGGFAGIPVEAVLDTRTLEQDEAAALVRLVDEADLPTMVGPTENVGPDAFLYVLTVDDARGTRTVSTTDPVPPHLQPLLDFIRAHAAPRD